MSRFTYKTGKMNENKNTHSFQMSTVSEEKSPDKHDRKKNWQKSFLFHFLLVDPFQRSWYFSSVTSVALAITVVINTDLLAQEPCSDGKFLYFSDECLGTHTIKAKKWNQKAKSSEPTSYFWVKTVSFTCESTINYQVKVLSTCLQNAVQSICTSCFSSEWRSSSLQYVEY